jgi:predicted glutamine amidotransferase
MCVIVVVQSKKDIPPYETLTKCGRNNADGMGYMYVKNNKVVINKGFFKVKSLHESMQDNIPEESPVVIHFRIATHGAKTAGLCHPFPVTSNYETLCALDVTCDTGVAHNGVLSAYGKINKEYSDTQNYIATVLAFVKDHITNDGVKQLISDSIGSDKLAFLTHEGIIHMFGNYTKLENVWYSNVYWNYTTYYPATTAKDDENDWLKSYRFNRADGFMTWDYCFECGTNTKTWTNKLGLCKICDTAFNKIKEKHGEVKAIKALQLAKAKAGKAPKTETVHIQIEECWYCHKSVPRTQLKRGLCPECDAKLIDDAYEVCAICPKTFIECKGECDLLLRPVPKELSKIPETGQEINDLILDLVEGQNA